jgi:hypothetical protein
MANHGGVEHVGQIHAFPGAVVEDLATDLLHARRGPPEGLRGAALDVVTAEVRVAGLGVRDFGPRSARERERLRAGIDWRSGGSLGRWWDGRGGGAIGGWIRVGCYSS